MNVNSPAHTSEMYTGKKKNRERKTKMQQRSSFQRVNI